MNLISHIVFIWFIEKEWAVVIVITVVISCSPIDKTK